MEHLETHENSCIELHSAHVIRSSNTIFRCLFIISVSLDRLWHFWADDKINLGPTSFLKYKTV